MSEAEKPLTAEEEREWREHDALVLPRHHRKNRMWATLDAERAKVEALKRDKADMLQSSNNYCAEIEARATAAEAEAERLGALANDLLYGLDLWEGYGCPICRGDCASANPPVQGCPVKLTYDLKRRAALAKEKPDAN